MSKKQPWLPQEIEALRKLYPDHTAAFVANVLGRSERSVHNKAFALGLAKAPGFWKTVVHPVTDTQFKKGMQPWNKGKPGTTGHHPNTKATQFKKGETPRNTLPLGSLPSSTGVRQIQTNHKPTTTVGFVFGAPHEHHPTARAQSQRSPAGRPARH